ncbi:MAG: hypothetical protein FWC32_04120 [Firmicutes bacterium]|nr:hypothetical protein [Bacillota bacterium]
MKSENVKNEKFLQDLAKQYVKKAGEIYKQDNDAIIPAPTPGLDGKMRAARHRQKWQSHRRAFMSVAASIVVLVIAGIAFLPQFLTNFGTDGTANFATESVMPGAEAPAALPAPQAAAPPVVAEAAPMEDGMDDPAADAAVDGSWNLAVDVAVDDSFGLGIAEEEREFSRWEAAVPVEPPAVNQRRALAQISLPPPPGWQIIYTDFDGDMVIFHLEGNAQNLVIVTAIIPPAENDFSEFFPVLINETWAYMRIESTHSVLIYQLDGIQFSLTTTYDYNDLITLAHNWV